jgi:hypothetical protein
MGIRSERLSSGYFPGVWVLKDNVSEHCFTLQHLLKMEPTQCSEMSAFNTHTPGKYPEDNLSLQQHGESLKTRYQVSFLKLKQQWCGVNHHPPSSTKVKERVELYLYSPSETSCKVIRLTIPLGVFSYKCSHMWMQVFKRICKHMDNFYQHAKNLLPCIENKCTLSGTNTKSNEHSIQVTIKQWMTWQQSHECNMFCCIQPTKKKQVQCTLMKNCAISNKTTSWNEVYVLHTINKFLFPPPGSYNMLH